MKVVFGLLPSKGNRIRCLPPTAFYHHTSTDTRPHQPGNSNPQRARRRTPITSILRFIQSAQRRVPTRSQGRHPNGIHYLTPPPIQLTPAAFRQALWRPPLLLRRSRFHSPSGAAMCSCNRRGRRGMRARAPRRARRRCRLGHGTANTSCTRLRQLGRRCRPQRQEPHVRSGASQQLHLALDGMQLYGDASHDTAITVLPIPQEFVQDAALHALTALSKGYFTESAHVRSLHRVHS